MAIYNHLPTYHQVEPSNLKGLQAGLVVAQMELDPSATTLLTNGMFENGHICGIGPNGIVAADETTDALFIHFSEPLNTSFRAEKHFAINPNHECGRLVQLMPGDEWVSDMEVSDSLKDRIVEIDGEVWNDVRLADGTPAHHYRYIGKAVSDGGSTWELLPDSYEIGSLDFGTINFTRKPSDAKNYIYFVLDNFDGYSGVAYLFDSESQLITSFTISSEDPEDLIIYRQKVIG